MKPIINEDLIQTLQTHKNIEDVYFEKESGLHHFNHVKRHTKGEMKGKETVNGKEVERWSRQDVLSEGVTHESKVGPAGTFIHTERKGSKANASAGKKGNDGGNGADGNE